MRFQWLLLGIFLLAACSPKAPVEKEGMITLNGSEVFYKTVGAGEPFLIIHGGPVLDHTYLYEHFLPLAKDYQLIFYDQRACGKSAIEVDSASMNLEGFVSDIDLLRKSLGLEQMHVLGHSWGGLLAMKYAITHPENIKRVVLSNSMAPSSSDWTRDNLKQAGRINAQDQKRLDKLVSSGLLRSAQAAQYVDEMMKLAYKSQMFNPQNIEKLHLNIPSDFSLRNQVFSLLTPDLIGYNLYEALASVNAPTLIVYGNQETAIETFADELTQALPEGQLAVIENSGHFPFIEQPEAYFHQIALFLNKSNE